MSNRQGSVLNWSSSSVPNKDCKRNAEFFLTNASVNTCTLQDGAHSLGAKARPLTHWQITLRSAQGKHSISQPVTNHTQFCTGKHSVNQTNHSLLCTGQTQHQSASDKSHPILHRQTHSVNQTNHNLLCTGQTQRQSANDKSHPILHRQTHSVNQTNHNLLCTGQTQCQSANDKSHSDRTVFSIFFNFSCDVLRLPFLWLMLMTYLCTCLFFNSVSKQQSIQGYNGGCCFPKLWLTCACLQVCRSKV